MRESYIEEMYRLTEDEAPSEAYQIKVVRATMLRLARDLEAFSGQINDVTAKQLGLDVKANNKFYDLLVDDIIGGLEAATEEETEEE